MFTSFQNDICNLDYINYNSFISDNNLYINEDYYIGNSLISNHFHYFYEENSTFVKSNSNYCFNDNINELEKNNLPNFNSISFIIDDLSKYIDEETKNKLLEGTSIENTKNYQFIQFTNKKKREGQIVNTPKKNDIFVQINIYNKRGRKKKNYLITKIHDKSCPDNIIKKIKSKLFKIMLDFLNKVLNLEGNNKLLKLDYSLIDKFKREIELKLLNKTLKEIFSYNISTKFRKSTRPPNFNKLIIDKIINKDFPSIDDYQTKEFVLNMTYNDFIQYFIHEKNIEDINNSYNNINYEKIKENFPFIESILCELLNKNDSNYVCFFLFYLFNLKRYLLLKQIRVSKVENDKKEMSI